MSPEWSSDPESPPPRWPCGRLSRRRGSENTCSTSALVYALVTDAAGATPVGSVGAAMERCRTSIRAGSRSCKGRGVVASGKRSSGDNIRPATSGLCTNRSQSARRTRFKPAGRDGLRVQAAAPFHAIAAVGPLPFPNPFPSGDHRWRRRFTERHFGDAIPGRGQHGHELVDWAQAPLSPFSIAGSIPVSRTSSFAGQARFYRASLVSAQ
jgi:hypothetical protein